MIIIIIEPVGGVADAQLVELAARLHEAPVPLLSLFVLLIVLFLLLLLLLLLLSSFLAVVVVAVVVVVVVEAVAVVVVVVEVWLLCVDCFDLVSLSTRPGCSRPPRPPGRRSRSASRRPATATSRRRLNGAQRCP